MADASFPSPEILYPDWQNEYVAALFEFDSEKLLERVRRQKPLFSIAFRPYRKAQTATPEAVSLARQRAEESQLLLGLLLRRPKIGRRSFEKTNTVTIEKMPKTSTGVGDLNVGDVFT